MIDVDELILELDKRARKLAALDDVRLEHELKLLHERAAAAFVAAGESELEAFLSADAVVQRLRSLIANHRRRRAQAGGGGQKQAEGGAPPARG